MPFELLTAGLMDSVYQSDAYEGLPGVLVNRGKGHLFQGNRGKMPNSEGNKDNILEQGTYENKFSIWKKREQANLFKRNKETGTPPPP